MYENIFNQNFIQQQAQQNDRNFQQAKNVLDSTQKLKKFLNSLEKIEPDYQNGAIICFCSVLWDYFQKRN